MSTIDRHIEELRSALVSLDGEHDRLRRWGAHVTERLRQGGRLLAAGNGGSAAHAQHLTAELVGRYRRERQPFSAIALHCDTSALTAIVNDYGPDEAFARQVRAHGRPDDVLVCLSTSGRSPNLVAAADAAKASGLTVLAITGPGPNPVTSAADDALCVPGDTPTIQEVHQVVVHLLCACIDDVVLGEDSSRTRAASHGRDSIGPVPHGASAEAFPTVGEPGWWTR